MANLLEVKAAIQIQKTASEIFEAIVDPSIMSNYFISHGSARMIENTVVMWQFPEFEGENPVRVGRIEKDKYISFYWEMDGKELCVEIKLDSQPDNSTVVRVTEKGMENNDKGIQWLIGNTEGWANFLACLKAWLEYGIHLRKGAFEFMRE